MLRLCSLAPLFASALLASCADSSTPNDESVDGDKQDQATENAFFTVNLKEPGCQSVSDCEIEVSKANQAQTNCGPFTAEACFLADIGWERSRISEAMAKEWEARLLRGDELLLAGDLGHRKDGPVLHVVEIWVPQSASGNTDPAKGSFVQVEKKADVPCKTFGPCANISEQKLNSDESELITGIDMSLTGADDAAIAKAREELDNPNSLGLILFGSRVTPGEGEKVLSASQFYLRKLDPR